MLILADHNIPQIKSACSGLGEIRLFDSRDLVELRRLVPTADVLLCRSTIRVDADLLAGTPVRFVATATSGTDHFDTAWLDAHGITHASAAGSNARSVAEWWVAVMLELQARERISLDGATSVGIVGVGHVGTQVADVACAMGMRCVYNDPPRERCGETPVSWSDVGFSSMEEILACDVVTLHVPLTREGGFPTAGFFGEGQFSLMHPGTVFVNAARGGVMEPAAVLRWAERGNPVVLDVFPGEPRIDPALVNVADIATPHIAGHAWDGKLRGTEMVAEALRGWIRMEPGRRVSSDLDTSGHEDTKTQRHENIEREHLPTIFRRDVYGEVLEVVRGVYDVRVDDAALRAAVEMDGEAAAAEFARLRAEYSVRREFAACDVNAAGLAPEAVKLLHALGLRLH
ncbi:MAG: 4-phosphoerythronate dehydrogenase [Bacteroidetes bacterium]|nr:4-phosphoerythronate dehydrogenase [Bacteroidota bacterium]